MMRPVEVVAVFKTKGVPRPAKISIQSDLGQQTFMVDKIISQDIEKLAGNQMIKYQCESEIMDHTIQYELKYEIRTCTWYISTK